MKQFFGVTAGHEWGRLTPDMIMSGAVPSPSELHMEDLQEQYPMPDASRIRDAHEERRIDAVELGRGLILPLAVYNEGVEDPENVVVYHPGFGVDVRTPNGAKSAATLAAFLPNFRVVIANRLEGVGDPVKEQIGHGNYDTYTQMLWDGLDERKVSPKVVAGPSLGGVLAQVMTYQRPSGIQVVSAQETLTTPTSLQNKLFDTLFGLRIMGSDNAIGQLQNQAKDKAEEAVYDAISFDTDTQEAGPKDLLEKRWQAMGVNRVNLVRRMAQTLIENPDLHVAYTHGYYDTGMSTKRVVDGVRRIMERLPEEERHRVGLALSRTGHYGAGNTPRFSRLTLDAIDKNAPHLNQ